jgi:hypothetical protein
VYPVSVFAGVDLLLRLLFFVECLLRQILVLSILSAANIGLALLP